MALTLYVDTARWRAYQRTVREAFPGLVPMSQANGYGFGNPRLAEEATRLGADLLAVGTPYEAAQAKDFFGGELLVLTPYRPGEDPLLLPHRVIRSVSSVEGVRGLAGARVIVEVMGMMKRHGVTDNDLPKLCSALEDVQLDGFALHLPLDRTDGTSAVHEVGQWMDRLRGARLPLRTVLVSHLPSHDLHQLRQEFPQTRFRVLMGTVLWLGDRKATEYRGAVLDVIRVLRGDRFGYRQHKAWADGHLVVVAGGTAHGIGLEAPKTMQGMMPRAKGVARAGLATVNKTLSPFVWAGRRRWFAEPPHMQVSVLFLPSDVAPPAVGDELVAHLRHTTTHCDRLIDQDCGPRSAPPADPSTSHS